MSETPVLGAVPGRVFLDALAVSPAPSLFSPSRALSPKARTLSPSGSLTVSSPKTHPKPSPFQTPSRKVARPRLALPKPSLAQNPTEITDLPDPSDTVSKDEAMIPSPSVLQHHPAMRLIFTPSRDKKQPYINDHDPDMETAAMIEARAALREDANVRRALSDFVDFAYKFDVKDRIFFDDYLSTHMDMSAILLPKASEQRRQELARLDWETDSQEIGYMSRDEVLNSIFSLVDVWCLTAEPSEYVAFLDVMKMRLTYKPVASGDPYSVLDMKTSTTAAPISLKTRTKSKKHLSRPRRARKKARKLRRS